MCKGKAKVWIKFNSIFFTSIIFFGFTLIVTTVRVVIKAYPEIEQKINGEVFTLIMEILLTISTLIFGFYWANYKVKKDARIDSIDNYIKDFTNSHKWIKNILEDFEYIRFDSIEEIKLIVKTIDKYFGLHYFNIFISNKKLASVYISDQIGKFMVDINKQMKKINIFYSKAKYQFGADKEKITQIINNYIKNVNKNSKNQKDYMAEFGQSVINLSPRNKHLTFDVLISALEALESINTFLRKTYISEVIKKLKVINQSLRIKSTVLQKVINNCKNHNQNNHRNDNNFCLKSQNLIMINCINKSWQES